MSPPSWWNHVRYGLHVHASVASVPAFAPIGAEAGWYHRSLGRGPAPLVEVLAHHRDRWGFVSRYEEFAPLLTFEHFDADGLATLAADGGMGLVAMTARHHDGFCWWDAPGTDWTSVRHGPGRNVVDELAGACERVGIRFATSYSVATAGTDDPDAGVVRSQLADLVERYGAPLLAMRADGWYGVDADLFIVRDGPPDEIVDSPWALARPFGWSAIHNRAEPVDRHLSAGDLLAVLARTAATGGALLLEVGLDAEGTLARHQADAIRGVGAWLDRHPEIVVGSRPFTTWGDDDVCYTVPATGAGARVHAVDLRGAGHFAALHTEAHRIRTVEAAEGAAVSWIQDRDGLHVTRLDRTPPGLAAVYDVVLEPGGPPVTLFEGTPPPPTPLGPLLAGAGAGDVVRLGEGRYGGPAAVPAGVILVGAGQERTTVVVDPPDTVVLGVDAHLTDLTIRPSRAPAPVPGFAPYDRGRVSDPAAARASDAERIVVDGDRATIERVVVEGVVRVRAASSVVIDGCTLEGVTGCDAEALVVRDSTLHGDGHATGIELSGGSSHRIDGNEIVGHHRSIRISGAAGVLVRRNRLRARWSGVHLVDCHGATVTANMVDTTMRAVDVAGGTAIEVAANVVGDGDSGCIVEAGAVDVTVVDNRWERCRIGLLVWDAPATHVASNHAVALIDEAMVIGPDAP